MGSDQAIKVGIRFEDKSEWERRVPIIPVHTKTLQAHGLSFLVEPSEHRTYSDDRYRQAGAEVTPDLSPAKVIFAVKEIPPEKLMAGKTYVFFSHVIKGQLYNMGLLRRLLDLNCTLIDYERIANDQGRLVFFGFQAGQAGMIDTLSLLGHRLQRAGQPTPLAGIRMAHEYEDVAEAKDHIASVGAEIARAGLSIEDAPLTFGFTGYGHVSQGAQDIFDLLPHEVVDPDDLARTVDEQGAVRDRLFKSVLKKPHLATPIDDDKLFDVREYHAHPHRYRGRLTDYLPYLTTLVNCIYWTDAFPRFLTREQAQELWRSGERKLLVIGDITCDIDGAIELTHKAMHSDLPGYTYEPRTDTWEDGFEGSGIALLTVDNLPCEIPRDASDLFSQALLPFVPAIAKADYSRPFEKLDLPPEIHRAVVTHQGELTPDHRYLEEYLEIAEEMD